MTTSYSMEELIKTFNQHAIEAEKNNRATNLFKIGF